MDGSTKSVFLSKHVSKFPCQPSLPIPVPFFPRIATLASLGGLRHKACYMGKIYIAPIRCFINYLILHRRDFTACFVCGICEIKPVTLDNDAPKGIVNQELKLYELHFLY